MQPTGLSGLAKVLSTLFSRGIETYGDPEDDTQVWSVAWHLQDYQEFLFTSVDLQYWMIVSKEELIGIDGSKWYSEEPITVTASSESDTPYQGRSKIKS